MADTTTTMTTAKDAPFLLARATVEDMEEITDLAYECFPPSIREIAMGVSDRARDLPNVLAHYLHELRTEPSDLWIKVTDKATGRIIAGSNWRVHLNGPPEDRPMDRAPGWLEGEAKAKAEDFVRRTDEAKRGVLSGVAFMHLHICFTDPEYRRRGAGSLMLKWGCEVMDLLGLAGWIEASEDGNYLYKVHGFYDHSRLGGDLDTVNMKRDAPVWSVQGGK